MSYVIRKATAEDAEALEKCISRAYAAHRVRISDLPDVTAGLGDDIALGRVWIAETGNAHGPVPAGGLILIAQDGIAKLANVAVDPAAQGTGLGRRLIEAAEDVCRGLGISALSLTTHAQMPENLALYARLGWQVTGRSGNKVHMQKNIASEERPE